MDALRSSRGDDKIPRRLKDPRGTEGLPKGDIEFAPRGPATRQPRHDHSVSHSFHYPPNCRTIGPQSTFLIPVWCPRRITHFSSKVQGVPVTLPRLR